MSQDSEPLDSVCLLTLFSLRDFGPLLELFMPQYPHLHKAVRIEMNAFM